MRLNTILSAPGKFVAVLIGTPAEVVDCLSNRLERVRAYCVYPMRISGEGFLAAQGYEISAKISGIVVASFEGP
jgi:hypothetical protein